MKELSCYGLCYSLKDRAGEERCILDMIDCSFQSGTVTMVTGPVGAGKSTLLHLLGMLMRPTSGEVKADGETVSRWVTAHKDLWRRKTGVVFQHPKLLRGLTVLENVMIPLLPRGMSLSAIRGTAMESLERVAAGHLAAREDQSISGGERQRVALATALAGKPELILADEPSSQQDGEGAGLFARIFNEEARSGIIVVLTSHDDRFSGGVDADRHLRIEQGRLAP